MEFGNMTNFPMSIILKPQQLMNLKQSQPNCGAVITGDKCEYCGTVFNRKENYDEVFTSRDSTGRVVTQYIGNVCIEPEE